MISFSTAISSIRGEGAAVSACENSQQKEDVAVFGSSRSRLSPQCDKRSSEDARKRLVEQEVVARVKVIQEEMRAELQSRLVEISAQQQADQERLASLLARVEKVKR